MSALIGCSSLGGGSCRQNIATVIQTAYDLGGREMHLRRSRQVPRRAERGALRSKVARGCAVSNKIESLVAEGKLTPSQAVRLHALAQLAYEGIMDDLTAGGAATNATPTSTSQGGCGDCSIPDASGGFTDTTLLPTMFIASRIIQESPICKSATIYPNPLAVRTHLMLYYSGKGQIDDTLWLDRKKQMADRATESTLPAYLGYHYTFQPSRRPSPS